jgi:hypothetical protein
MEVKVDFISPAVIGTYGRPTGWKESEEKKAREVLENMRRAVRLKRGDEAAGSGELVREGGGEAPLEEPASEGQGLQPDGTIIERIPLPALLVGDGQDQLRKQTLFRVEQVKKRSLEGKIVLASS